jgi:hypothetical protein
MTIEKQTPMNRTSLTVVGLVLLFAAWIAYGQGWFDWARSSSEMERNQPGSDQTLEEGPQNEAAARFTQASPGPAATPQE